MPKTPKQRLVVVDENGSPWLKPILKCGGISPKRLRLEDTTSNKENIPPCPVYTGLTLDHAPVQPAPSATISVPYPQFVATPRQRERLRRICKQLQRSPSYVSDSEPERAMEQEREARELPGCQVVHRAAQEATVETSVVQACENPRIGTEELTATTVPRKRQRRWNEPDIECPEGRRLYYRRLRLWRGGYGSYQAERMRRCAQGTIAIDSEGSDT
ncbi:hypothetical protein PHLCEN_2v234 [Hermanssonia centrifuga]|uniref:Uncharacterized protein n=1 Tax=Hermanssonia centrifuga TaxID=98765 RepID=A0A2R6S6V1_9APHY|nr:hypothetical protein PHLCEN_2v234 [Hermanssonia centrifuga]